MKQISSAAQQFDADCLKICRQAIDQLQTHLDASQQMSPMELDALDRAVERLNRLMCDFTGHRG